MTRLLAVLIFAVTLFACKKSNDHRFVSTYTVHGISDVTMESGDFTVYQLEIRYESGEQRPVELFVNGMPEGMTARFSTARGIPDFTSVLTINTADELAEGDYPLTITTDDGVARQDYEFNVRVKNCLRDLVGAKTGINKCGRDNLRYEAEIFWYPSTEDYVMISNFAGKFSSLVYAEVDCETSNFQIPQQTVTTFAGEICELWGTGTFKGSKVEVSFSYRSHLDPSYTIPCNTVLE